MNWDSLPEGWKVKTLGTVIDLLYGRRLSSQERRPQGPYAVYGSNGLIGRTDRYFIEDRTIIVGRKGACGSITLTEPRCWSIDTTFYVQVRSPLKLDLNYLFFYLKQMDLSNLIVVTAVPGINRNTILSLPIPLPPLEEQRRIVEILEQADDPRWKKKASLALIDKIIRSLFLDMFGDPATNPKGWEARKLGEAIAVAQTGFAYGKWRDAEGIPQLRPFNITSEGKLDFSTLKYVPENAPLIERHLLQPDDIVFNNTNSPELVGKAAVFRSDQRCVFSNHLTRIRLDSDKATPDYVALVLIQLWEDRFFRDRCQQWVNQAAINIDRLKAIEIPLPPLALQQRFAELVAHFVEKRRQMEQAAENLEKLYQSLLKKAFTGELTRAWREANGVRWELPQLTERQKLLLGVLNYHNSVRKVAPPVTVVMKNMFLLQEEQKVPLGYSFVPYKYGPFSKEVYEDLEALEREMLVVRVKRTKSVERQETTIDEEAVEDMEQILETVPRGKRKALDELMEGYGAMGFEQLLDYVYAKYPEFAGRSKRSKQSPHLRR